MQVIRRLSYKSKLLLFVSICTDMGGSLIRNRFFPFLPFLLFLLFFLLLPLSFSLPLPPPLLLMLLFLHFPLLLF